MLLARSPIILTNSVKQKNCSFGIDYDSTFPRGDEWMMSVCGADTNIPAH